MSKTYPAWLPILLGFLTAVGPLSTDMYLPAFPSIEASFHTAPGTAQITLATWFTGLAIGQLTQGSLSDRYGRRGPLVAGTLLYTLCSAGCALSPNLASLAVLRFVTAFAASASMVIPRAVVRDLADGHEAARLMSRLILVMGAAPILAPSLGGLLLTFASWRLIFWFAAAYGAVCLVLVWLKLPDTLAERDRVRLGAAGLVQRYLHVGQDRIFLAYAAMGGCGMFGMFAYIGGSPTVLIGEVGLSPEHFGMLFGASAAFYVIASQINPFLLHRFGAGRILRGAVVSYVLAALTLFGCAVFHAGGIFGIVPPIMITLGSMGLIMPNSAVGALSRHAAQAGSASALMGTLQFCLAALAGGLVGILSDGTARPMASLMLLAAAGVVIADQFRSRRPPLLEQSPASS